MASLFDPITVGAIDAPNRIMMAPLTRGRATRSHVPTPLMGEYYSQRASAGLIISEATGITQQGLGWPNAPGLWSREQPATRQLVPAIRRVFKGTLILNSDYSLDDASQALRLGEAEAIAFGRPFLANPDLPARLAKRAALNAPNTKTFYTPGPSGYTDYPALT
ncbi:MAG TPA: hypothetical protein VNY80_01455 [Steroidobacteraceae bacterium]|jgi:2,4-dienoyl-CoA reductase-like NADH-dependent reductase (Old Yellow Enzyme family)|nr:hypothetical protein [Steroidobacteraceae bacterium]